MVIEKIAKHFAFYFHHINNSVFLFEGKIKFRKMSNGEPLPNSRLLSTTLFTESNILSNEYNIIFYGFGQWIDHDITLSVPQMTPSNSKFKTDSLTKFMKNYRHFNLSLR